MSDSLSESVMLPSTDPEAVAYLAQERVSTTNGPTSESTDPIRTPPTSTTSQIYSSMAAPQPFPPQTSIPSKPTPKPPVRRKPRQSLEQMSAALSSGKKMTTLEKVRPRLAKTAFAYADDDVVAAGLV